MVWAQEASSGAAILQFPILILAVIAIIYFIRAKVLQARSRRAEQSVPLVAPPMTSTLKEPVSRVCRACSALSETDKTFCPHCGTPFFTNSNGPTIARANGKATTALVLGLVGLVLFGFILGVLAIVFASLAKAEISRQPNAFTNSGAATAGLVLGIVDIVAGVLIFVWLFG